MKNEICQKASTDAINRNDGEMILLMKLQYKN